MKYEIRDNHNTIALLRQWFDTIDPKTYRKQNPWSGELTDAYEHYKYLDKIFIQRKAIYMNEPLLTLEATPDQHVKSIQLAIEWGEAALRYSSPSHSACVAIATQVAIMAILLAIMLMHLVQCSSAKARIHVLANYRNAYDVTVIHSHIEEAERHLFSAMSALREARTNFQGTILFPMNIDYIAWLIGLVVQ